jgi:hypothetical protein
MPITVVHETDSLDDDNVGKRVLYAVDSSPVKADGSVVDIETVAYLLDADAVGLSNLPPNTNVNARREGVSQATLLPSVDVPLAAATAQSTTVNLTRTFSGNISKGAGNIELYNVTLGATIATVAVASATVTITDATATYNPASALAAASVIEVRYDAGVFALTADTTQRSRRLVYRFTTA